MACGWRHAACVSHVSVNEHTLAGWTGLGAVPLDSREVVWWVWARSRGQRSRGTPRFGQRHPRGTILPGLAAMASLLWLVLGWHCQLCLWTCLSSSAVPGLAKAQFEWHSLLQIP